MNPFFWLLVLLGAVALWFGLRGIFVQLGSQAAELMEDTADILNSDETNDENGGDFNA